MNDNLIRAPARSLKEQFSRSSAAWKEQSDPIFRFWAAGDSWGFPLFSLSASRYFGDKETLCLYWPLGTVVITGPKVLDFYAGFCAHRVTCLKADGKDITELKLIINGDSNAENEANALNSWSSSNPRPAIIRGKWHVDAPSIVALTDIRIRNLCWQPSPHLVRGRKAYPRPLILGRNHT